MITKITYFVSEYFFYSNPIIVLSIFISKILLTNLVDYMVVPTENPNDIKILKLIEDQNYIILSLKNDVEFLSKKLKN